MYKIKVPFGTISITEKSKNLILDLLEKKRLSSGQLVREFERNFASLIGVKEAVAVSSGTDAVALSLSVLYDYGAKRGDEIIVPSLSFIGTANGILQAGFTPKFVDVKLETLNINPSLIEKEITNKTKAILVVHLMGKPAEMEKINEIAKKYNLWVIEDAAEAHGGKYKGKNLGTIGNIGAFSLYIAHIITTIEGGIIVTNDSEIAKILRSLRAHGRACKCDVCTLNISTNYCPKRFQNGKDIRFVFERVGFSSKMNELEAAVGIGNLEIYEEILKKRRANLLLMMEKFKQFSYYFITLKEEPYEEIGPHAFPVILKKNLPFSRNELVEFLIKHGIDTRDLFSSIPTQCNGYKFLNYKLGDFPISEYIGNNGFHIGVHQDIKKSDIEYIIETIKKFLKKYGENF